MALKASNLSKTSHSVSLTPSKCTNSKRCAKRWAEQRTRARVNVSSITLSRGTIKILVRSKPRIEGSHLRKAVRILIRSRFATAGKGTLERRGCYRRNSTTTSNSSRMTCNSLTMVRKRSETTNTNSKMIRL